MPQSDQTKPLDPLLYEHMVGPGHSNSLTELGFGASEICTPVRNLTAVGQVDDSVRTMRLCVIRHFFLLPRGDAKTLRACGCTAGEPCRSGSQKMRSRWAEAVSS